MDLRNGTIPPEKVRDIIDQANKEYHVIGAMSFGDVPEGHSVTLNVRRANPDPKAGDVYDVGMGKFGLTGNLLNALADAAGVSVVNSTMLVYTTNYCVTEVTVARMGLDGRVRRATSRKVMDLREGSGQLKAMRDAAKEKGKDGANQIREQRLRIAEHADSKARLRAIRALLSIRTYTNEELQKPFAVFTLQFTGRTNDPQLRQIFAVGLMQASLGAMGALYGSPVPVNQPQALPMGQPAPAGLLGAAPPIDVGDGIPDEGETPRGEEESPPAPKKIVAADPKKVFLPGKKGEAPSIYHAPDDVLLPFEKKERAAWKAGKWDGNQYHDLNMRRLLTTRWELRDRGVEIEADEVLDVDVRPVDESPRGGGPKPDQRPAPASPPTNGNGNGERPADPALPRRPSYGQQRSTPARPPSDKGPPADPRSEDNRLADAAFGPDDEDHGPDDR
jgi:hypothetical protein